MDEDEDKRETESEDEEDCEDERQYLRWARRYRGTAIPSCQTDCGGFDIGGILIVIMSEFGSG